ncbi:MAG: hypothetical protein F2819_04680, partial [Actinobacteria bacterium]|nr:hypothetical protein [Actinomycetota bacterium]
MSRVNLRMWNFRLRKALLVALLAPLLSVLPTAPTAYALTTPTTGGAFFDRSLQSYLSVSASSNFVLGTSENFTIAWWQYSTNNTDWPRTWRFGSGANELTISQEGGTFYLWRNTGSYSGTLFTQTTTLNNWVHYAIVRTAGTLRIYENAIQKVSVANTQAFGDSSSPFLIGTNLSYSADQTRVNFGGLLTGFEFIKGTAKYSGTSTTAENFSPATTLAGYTTSVTSGTKLLLFPTSSADLLTDRSGSGGNYTITNTASPSNMPVKFGNLPATLTYSINGAAGTTPTAVTQSAPAQAFSLPTSSGFSRSNFTFMGWNSQADGKGTNYPASSSFTPTANVTLYAQWNSVINYGGNSPTSTRSIESTTATTASASTTLSNGKLTSAPAITNGLTLNLNGADSSSVTSTQWIDRSVSATNATLFGSPTYDSVDGSFRLNGTNQYFNLGNSALNYTGTQKFTFNVMFKSDTPMQYDCLICRYATGANRSYMLISDTQQLFIHREVSPWNIKSTTTYDAGNINYATMVYDGTRMIGYINGVEVSRQNSGTVGTSTVDTLIGAGWGSGVADSFFTGKIYSVQAYNRDLSQSEIQQNYLALLPSERVSKNNFTLAGWSTSPSSGTVVAGASTDLTVLPTPYLRLLPANYNASTKVWTATNG